MKVEQKEKIILVNKYIAKDGKEFDSKKDCIKYEKGLELNNDKLFKSIINDVYNFWDNERSYLIYLSKKEDLDSIKYYYDTEYIIEDFEKYGKGWYMIKKEYTIDSYWYCLYNIENYTKDIEFQFNEWKSLIEKKINEKTSEMT